MPGNNKSSGDACHYTRSADGTIQLLMNGNWYAGSLPLSPQAVEAELMAVHTPRIVFDTENLEHWNSGLITFLTRVKNFCDELGVVFDGDNLPDGAKRLLALAVSCPVSGIKERHIRQTFLERVADRVIVTWKSIVETFAFLGEATVACGRLLTGRARFRYKDFIATIQECGAQALPIVSLISLLVGLILAFVGAVQLSMFGAQIYVASLVGIGIVRVMGAIMTGIIMAGRTGASFAARLGTMQVNDEIDALSTLGISPIEFLVLPRVVALVFMMPLLCLYADLMGIIGGLVVGVFMLDLNAMEYIIMTKKAVRLQDFWIGFFHSGVFGVLVALSGCLRGIQCGRSASAVGDAATSAVVTGIVSIVVATAIITVICNFLGI